MVYLVKQKIKTPVMLILICYILAMQAGCAPLVVGAALGVAGGYAVSKDTVIADSDKPYDRLWDKAIENGVYRGEIKNQNRQKGRVEIESAHSRIWVSFIRLTAATTRVKVSARTYRLPDLQLAQDVMVKILEQAK